jgi:hypothetical protein
VISKHGHFQEGRAPRHPTSMQIAKDSMVKGIKEIILYLSCPSQWRKMQLFGLVVVPSFRKFENYSI